jgi:hypothetical protein
MEAFMHSLIYVSVAAFVIVTGGVIMRPSPSATVSTPPGTGATIDVDALQQKIDVRALPTPDYGDLM